MSHAQCFLSRRPIQDGARAVALLLGRVPGTSVSAVAATGALVPADHWTPVCPPLRGVVADAASFSPDPSLWGSLFLERLQHDAVALDAGPSLRHAPAVAPNAFASLDDALAALAQDRLFLRLPDGYGMGRDGTPDSVPVAWAFVEESVYDALTERFWFPRNVVEHKGLPVDPAHAYDPHTPAPAHLPVRVADLAPSPALALPRFAWASPLHAGNLPLVGLRAVHDAAWAVAALVSMTMTRSLDIQEEDTDDTDDDGPASRASAHVSAIGHLSPLWLVEKATSTHESLQSAVAAIDPALWAGARPRVEDLLRFSALGHAMMALGIPFAPGFIASPSTPDGYAAALHALQDLHAAR